jgi:hypothetical protein
MTDSTGRAWVTTEIDEDGEECLMLNFCKQFMEDLGWQEGDELGFTEREDGYWLIRKLN